MARNSRRSTRQNARQRRAARIKSNAAKRRNNRIAQRQRVAKKAPKRPTKRTIAKRGQAQKQRQVPNRFRGASDARTKHTKQGREQAPAKQTKRTPEPGRGVGRGTRGTGTLTNPSNEVRTKEGLANDYLGLIETLPPSQKNAMMGFFSQFQSMSIEDQQNFMDAMQFQANDAVDPYYDEQQRRLDEDYGYDQRENDMKRNHLQATFDRLARDVNLLREREIYKEQRGLAKTIFSLTNDEFVSGVAGSGIARRRKAEQRRDTEEDITDINIAANQKLGQARQALGQDLQKLDLADERLATGKERSDFDLDQERQYDRSSTFLDLLGNEAADIGQSVRSVMDTGAVTGSALESMDSDTFRQNRYKQEVRDARKKELEGIRAKEAESVNEALRLVELKTLLHDFNRTSFDAQIDAELQKRSGALSRISSEAKTGIVSDQEAVDLGIRAQDLFGGSGSGITVGMDELNRRAQLTREGLMYGNRDSKKLDEKKAKALIQQYMTDFGFN